MREFLFRSHRESISSEYQISWSALCFQGLIRMKNQDNLVTPQGCLPLVHIDTDVLSGTFFCEEERRKKMLAVFDGMGGEKDGEYASWLAADCFFQKMQEKNPDKIDSKQDIQQLYLDMNDRVCRHQEKTRRLMGTTAASISFAPDEIYCSNLGDSRIYRYSAGRLSQISVDHVPGTSRFFSNTLTQYLGIPAEEFVIEPEVVSLKYQDEDLYLLCSDGLTKLISDERLSRILQEKETLEQTLLQIKEVVLKKGAVDNTTVILCRIHRKGGRKK